MAMHVRPAVDHGYQERSKIAAAKGAFRHTTLDVAHAWHRDLVHTNTYQAGFQSFKPETLTKGDALAKAIARELDAPKDDDDDVDPEQVLDKLTKLVKIYKEIVEHRGRRNVPTMIYARMVTRIDREFAKLRFAAVEEADFETLRHLVEMVEDDKLVRQMVWRSTQMPSLMKDFHALKHVHSTKERDKLDDGAGGKRNSFQRRPSGDILAKTLVKERLDNYEHITFNPQSGRLNFVSNIVFQKADHVYSSKKPTSEFDDVFKAQEILDEIVRVYKIFQKPFDVVQVHKSPYQSVAKTDVGEHEDWLVSLAKARAKKMKAELVRLGVPPGMASAKVEKVSGSAIMQYCQFHLKFVGIVYDADDQVATVINNFEWEPRSYSIDNPQEPNGFIASGLTVKHIVVEVSQMAAFYGRDVEIVVHMTEQLTGMDLPKQMWTRAKYEHRADMFEEALIEVKKEPGRQVFTRIVDADEIAALGLKSAVAEIGVHFSFVDGSIRKGGRSESHDNHVLIENSTGGGKQRNAFNGKFFPTVPSTQGLPRYRMDGGGSKTITLSSDGFWYLGHNHDISTARFRCTDLEGAETWRDLSTSSTTPEIPVSSVVKREETSMRTMRRSSSLGSFGMGAQDSIGKSAMKKHRSEKSVGQARSVQFDKEPSLTIVSAEETLAHLPSVDSNG